MKNIKKLAAIICVFALVLSLCGCGGSSEKFFYIAMDKVSTLDPQLAAAQSDRTIVLNTYEGLIRLDKDDNPLCAAAETYTYNNLTYTFKLRKDAVWSDGTPLTADDFVFAFLRAVSPDTAAPDFSAIACIKGAREVKNGGDSSLLSVRAVDKHTLEIVLEYDDENFLKTLASPICMPCNKKFFESTNGKYGRDGYNILSNGSFLLNLWDTEEYLIRLYRNEKYTGNFRAVPAKVYITAAKENEKLTLLGDNDIDACFISGSEIEEAQLAGLNTVSFFDKYLFVLINKNSALGNDDVRRALSLSIHRNALANDMPSYIVPLFAAVQPNAVFDSGSISQNAIKSAALDYKPEEAYQIYLNATKVSGAINGQTILYPAELAIDPLISSVATGWQQNLGCFINITPSTIDDIDTAVKSGDFSVAVLSIDADDKNAYDLLRKFKSGNIYGFQNETFDQLINSLKSNRDANGYLNSLYEAQRILLGSNTIIPLATVPTVICTTDAIKSIEYSLANKTIDFCSIIKE